MLWVPVRPDALRISCPHQSHWSHRFSPASIQTLSLTRTRHHWCGHRQKKSIKNRMQHNVVHGKKYIFFPNLEQMITALMHLENTPKITWKEIRVMILGDFPILGPAHFGNHLFFEGRFLLLRVITESNLISVIWPIEFLSRKEMQLIWIRIWQRQDISWTSK